MNTAINKMKHKGFQKVLKLAAVSALFTSAAGEMDAGVRLADSTYLNFGLDSTVSYADNLFSRKTRTSDMYATVTPSISLSHDGTNSFSMGVYESFVSHLEHTGLNAQYPTFNLSYSFEPRALTGASEGAEGPGGRLRINTNVSYTQIAQNDNTNVYTDVEGNVFTESSLIRRDMYSAGGTAQYAISAKLNGSIGLNWNYDHFATARDHYNDSQSFAIPVSFHYNLSLYQIGLVYNWAYTDIEQNSLQRLHHSGSPGNTTNNYVGLSFIGPVPFTSKLTLRANAGYSHRQFSDRWFSETSWATDLDKKNGNYSFGTFGYNVALDWQIRSNLRASLSSGRHFEVGGHAQAITSTNVRLNVSAVLKSLYSVSTFLDYRLQEFDSRGLTDKRDNLYSFGLVVAYNTYLPSIRSNIYTSIGYRYLMDVSNRIDNFQSNIVTFSVGLRF